MIKIGITGGIGSGKTVVASLLHVLKIPVYIADEESKILTDESPVIRQKLIELFGENIYSSNLLNRKRLASYIFEKPDYLKAVNAIIHPEVNMHFLNWVAHQYGDICGIESAILFESGFDRIVDYTIMVYSPVELRIERVCRRNGMTREEVEHRINNQLSDEIKKQQSDYVIFNDGSRAIIPQLENILTEIRAK